MPEQNSNQNKPSQSQQPNVERVTSHDSADHHHIDNGDIVKFETHYKIMNSIPWPPPPPPSSPQQTDD